MLLCLSPLVLDYLLYRSEIGNRNTPASRVERVIGTFTLGHFIAATLYDVLRAVNQTREISGDLGIDTLSYGPLFVVGLLMEYGLVWWGGWAAARQGILP